jgi:molybdopterin synthase catalytic subunit
MCNFDIQLFDHPVAAVSLESFPRSAGAECIFLGRTRLESHPQHGDLQRLEYEAYEPMAVRVLNDLAQKHAARFGCLAVRIHHALGVVPPGQASVLVQVLCPHRAASFDACRAIIDELKSTVPIWKRERWADGTTWSRGTPVPGAGINESPPGKPLRT